MNNAESLPVVKELNKLLADYHLYYQKLRNFHWNIVGHNFFDLHLKFEEMYNDAKIKIDEIAERILTLKFHPLSNYSDYIENASIKESPSLIKDTEMVSILLSDNEILLEKMREAIKLASGIEDEATVDMLGSYIGELEKNTWMLGAWLDK